MTLNTVPCPFQHLHVLTFRLVAHSLDFWWSSREGKSANQELEQLREVFAEVDRERQALLWCTIDSQLVNHSLHTKPSIPIHCLSSLPMLMIMHDLDHHHHHDLIASALCLPHSDMVLARDDMT